MYTGIVSLVMVALGFWLGAGWRQTQRFFTQWCFDNSWLWSQQCFGGSDGGSSAAYAPWLQVAAPTAVAAASSVVVAL